MKDKGSLHLQVLVWGGLVLIMLFLGLRFAQEQWDQAKERHLTDHPLEQGPLPVLAEVGSFQLTNQLGHVVTQVDLSGHPWIANLIFTRCPGPCARMTAQMKELVERLKEKVPNLRFVTLTTDPAHDQPEVMQAYANRFGGHHDLWWFLTGEKEVLRKLSFDGLKLSQEEIPQDKRSSPNDLFVHSTLFAVVDSRGRLRTFFNLITQDAEEGKGLVTTLEVGRGDNDTASGGDADAATLVLEALNRLQQESARQ